MLGWVRKQNSRLDHQAKESIFPEQQRTSTLAFTLRTSPCSPRHPALPGRRAHTQRATGAGPALLGYGVHLCPGHSDGGLRWPRFTNFTRSQRPL